MLAFCPPVKKIKTEYGAKSSSSQSFDAESNFVCTKRKIVRRRLNTPIPVATSTTILDLNDDCLYKIFNLSLVSLSDFYSLSQTCSRLNGIGCDIFLRKVKICNLRHITDQNAEIVIGVLKAFRYVISELRLDMNAISHSNSSAILDTIIRDCTELKSLTIEGYKVPDNRKDIDKLGLLFKNLEKLHLEYVFIEDIDDSNAVETASEPLINNIFTGCQSLISLKVVNCYHFKLAIFESSFPKLEHFDYKSGAVDDDNNIRDFILRHRNLKTFRLDTDCNDYLEFLAGCKNLTNLNIRLDTKLYLHPLLHRPHSNVSDSVKSLANFQHLKELTIECSGYDAATKLIRVLPQLSQSLECFHVEYFSGSSALIPAVVQLKNLRIFRLHGHNGTIDISRMGELSELVELSLIDVEVKKVDLIEMANSLVNLKKLKFYVNDFQITNELYAQLLDVLGQRKPKSQHLEMYCRTAIDFVREFCQTMVEIKF
ncbi:uncharacterized protein LOC119068868 [Bradysia coprophila]|uniref:uncharacterized protein LOC119068868 n=1 Tax=Bradysia coprophila TaxID=38358 RepID=UPI00187DB6E8|nr:uncharacterized protein LOC119068868 [Bradysia coprophila]